MKGRDDQVYSHCTLRLPLLLFRLTYPLSSCYPHWYNLRGVPLAVDAKSTDPRQANKKLDS